MNSGDKGKRFELKIARLLSEWSGLELMRTPMSGGWAGEAADIVPKFGAFFPFVVECKHEEGWELDNIMLCNGPFPEWFAQCIEQAEYKSNSVGTMFWPMLCFRRNHRPTYMAVPSVVLEYGCIGSKPTLIVVQHIRPWEFILGEIGILKSVISYQKVMEAYGHYQKGIVRKSTPR